MIWYDLISFDIICVEQNRSRSILVVDTRPTAVWLCQSTSASIPFPSFHFLSPMSFVFLPTSILRGLGMRNCLGMSGNSCIKGDFRKKRATLTIHLGFSKKKISSRGPVFHHPASFPRSAAVTEGSHLGSLGRPAGPGNNAAQRPADSPPVQVFTTTSRRKHGAPILEDHPTAM